MKTIIAGSRGFADYKYMYEQLDNCPWNITEVVSGTAKGADQRGERWAGHKNIPVTKFPAKWDEYGKGAGYVRNLEMAEYADALIAFWDGESRGTNHMIEIAVDLGLYVKVVKYET